MFHHKPLSRPFSPYIREARKGDPSLPFLSPLSLSPSLFSPPSHCVCGIENRKGGRVSFPRTHFPSSPGQKGAKGGEGRHQNRKRGKKEVAFSPLLPSFLFGQNVRSTCEDALSGKEGPYWCAEGENSSATSFSPSDRPIFSFWLALCVENVVPISAVIGTAIQGDGCPISVTSSSPHRNRRLLV